MKKHYRYWLILLINLYLCLQTSYAQQDAQFSMYMYNQFYLNPAFAGIQREAQATVFHRTQWAGYSPSFDNASGINTQVISFQTYLPRLHSGVGIYFANDQINPLTNREAQLAYAFHLHLNKTTTLSIGIRGGIYQKTLDFTQLRAVDAGDPLILNTLETQIQPDAAAGIYLQSQKLFIGASMNHLNNANFNFGTNNQKNPLALTGYLIAGYNIEVSNKLRIVPSTLIKSDLNTFSVDLSALGYFYLNPKYTLWGGLAYRYQDAASIIVGANMPAGKNYWRAAYSFDYTLGGQSAKQNTSHEIMLSYIIPIEIPTPRKIVRTPRHPGKE
ncbi:MAG: type IX secretion system membrane protein PorP/SprF [Cytophagales bacterium]|nr:MAG: type IX secretion system membrane protein PorP/SprF [Cytophagales bacterium]